MVLPTSPAEPSSGGTHGDLGLSTAIVVLSAATIHALAVWLAKRRTRQNAEYDLSFEKNPDGTVRLRLRGQFGSQSSEPPDASTVDAMRSRLESLFDRRWQLPDDWPYR